MNGRFLGLVALVLASSALLARFRRATLDPILMPDADGGRLVLRDHHVGSLTGSFSDSGNKQSAAAQEKSAGLRQKPDEEQWVHDERPLTTTNPRGGGAEIFSVFSVSSRASDGSSSSGRPPDRGSWTTTPGPAVDLNAAFAAAKVHFAAYYHDRINAYLRSLEADLATLDAEEIGRFDTTPSDRKQRDWALSPPVRKLWTYWGQGLKNAPPIVKACHMKMSRLNPDWEVGLPHEDEPLEPGLGGRPAT